MPGEKRSSSTPLKGIPGAKPGGKENLSNAQEDGSFNNCGLDSCASAAMERIKNRNANKLFIE
jgi:hypothetical protein